MGADDDGDCVEHLWQLEEIHLTLDQAGHAYRCTRCGAVSYDDARTGQAARPALD